MAIDTTLSPEILEKIKDHGLILYDGECGFCQFWVQFVLKRDTCSYFFFAPLQAPWARVFFPDGKAPSRFDTVLLFEKDKLFEKSRAAFRIAGHLSWPWKFFQVFLIFPSWLPNIFYDFIARRRHRLASKDNCLIPTAEERKRFLE